MMKLNKFPYHSLFISIYPILYLYAKNIVFIPSEDILRSLVWSVGVTIILLIGFRLILKEWQKAGAICSLILILFYTFGHLAILLESWAAEIAVGFNAKILAWIWLCLFLLLSFIIFQSGFGLSLTYFFNVTSGFLLIFPLITVISIKVALSGNPESQRDLLSQLRGEQLAEETMRDLSPSEFPDIYYIILDAYERSDNLEEFYDYDNSMFINALEERGFYIASQSRSNYLNTMYSLNTSLNLFYLQEVPTRIFGQIRYNLQTNYVSDFLREQGYQIVVFDSGTGNTNDQYTDIFVSPISNVASSEQSFNPFEQLLLRTTLGYLMFTGGSLDDGSQGTNDVFISSVNHELSIRRERIRHALSHISDYASGEGPYFLFAHIYLPHYPFLYGPNGEELKYHENVNLYWYEIEPKNYVEYYTYQLDYLNQAVLESIDHILADTVKPVIIILQSDHGDEKFLDWETPTTEGLNVRSAILNAIYFSDGSYDSLYSTMTPVNNFRITFNHWFGTQFPILPDKVYFHEPSLYTPVYKKPEFIDGCLQFNICLPNASQ
jgi:hypothetical protein